MSVFDYAKEIKDAMYKAAGVNASENRTCQMADFILSRKWKKKEFPKNEETVLIVVETWYPGRKPIRRVLRAFYEDGRMKEAESYYSWILRNAEEDQDGDLLIPMGWYELTDYGEEIAQISDGVIAWQPLPDPWEGMEEQH